MQTRAEEDSDQEHAKGLRLRSWPPAVDSSQTRHDLVIPPLSTAGGDCLALPQDWTWRAGRVTTGTVLAFLVAEG